MPRLAVAMVHHHAESLLADCVASLRRSTLEDFAVCIVDNGSEGGLGWIEPLDPRFRVLRPGRNEGFARATNRALAALGDGFEHVLLLNPDVVVGERTLEEIARLLDRDPTIAAATCRLVQPSGALDPACRRSDPTLPVAGARLFGLQRCFPRSRRFGAYNLTHLDDRAPHDVEAASAAFLMIRRKALEGLDGPLDERFFLYGEDLDLCRRLRRPGLRIAYWPAVSALHVKGSGRARDAFASAHFHHAMWLYYRKWGRFRSTPFALVPLALALLALYALERVRLSRAAPS